MRTFRGPFIPEFPPGWTRRCKYRKVVTLNAEPHTWPSGYNDEVSVVTLTDNISDTHGSFTLRTFDRTRGHLDDN